MHVENELVEFMTVGEPEYEEIIEEYKEEILIQEGALEPPATNFADTPPAQGKPRYITIILNNHWIYICDVHLRYRHFMETTCIYITYLWVLLA